MRTKIGEPFYWEAADGTCGYGWNGSGGSVSGNAYNLTASGETWGEAWVWLTPDLGLSRYAYADYDSDGFSYVHLEGDIW